MAFNERSSRSVDNATDFDGPTPFHGRRHALSRLISFLAI